MALDLTGVEPSAESAAELFPPVAIGPIWVTDEDGFYLLPDYTLGWDVIAWAETKLNAIRGPGRLQLTNEQRRILLWFYAVNERGRFVYRRAVWQAFKGAGKDPFAAVVCLVELLGPVKFSHWGDGGQPVGVRDEAAWVQLFAVSKDQVKNTSSLFPTLVSQELVADHALDVQKEIIYAHQGRNRLEVVGSSHRSAEGNRTTFAILNETQHWTASNGGEELSATVRRNLTKTGGRSLSITNAYMPGEDSVAQQVREGEERVWAGLAKPSGTLYMSLEAHPDAPMSPEWIPHIMDTILGDAWWAMEDPDELVQDILDPSVGVTRSRRFFYNQVVTGEDALFSVTEWDNALQPNTLGSEEDLRPGDEIVLGFDGGKTEDATALVAIRVRDKLIVPIVIEQKPLGPQGEGWRVDDALMNESVLRAFATYKVRAFYADTALWESYIASWSEEFGEQLEVKASPHSSIGWDMRGSRQRISEAWESYVGSIVDGRLKHNGNRILRTHALNARRGHNGIGLLARKENRDSPNKIDAMVASYVAYAALNDLLEKGNRGRKRHKPGRIIRGSY